MSAIVTADEFISRLEAMRSDEQVEKYKRYFKFTDDDIFIGVGMGQVFTLVKESLGMPAVEIEKLLESRIHEVRTGACSAMDKITRKKKTPEPQRKELYDLYLRRHDRINNWDLVDICAPHVIGRYLVDKPRDILYDLAKSPNIWQRRTSMVSTFYFVRFMDDPTDTLAIAELLLVDKEDLIHKATGWGLRVVGGPRLIEFLDQHAATMPRTALRYSIEHLDKVQRTNYMSLKKSTSNA